MFFDPSSGVLSILVPTNGNKQEPKIFINIPPGCTDLYAAENEQIPDLLSIKELLVGFKLIFSKK